MWFRRNPIASDPTAAIETHEIDDRFIPVRATELIAALIEYAADRGLPPKDLREFAVALRSVIEQEAAAFSREMADAYAPFNPDRETLPQQNEEYFRTPDGYAAMHARFEYLMDKSNFERLNDVRIDQALQVASSQGLTVRLDPGRVEELSLWIRGYGEIERTRRSWRRPIRGTTHKLEVFRRLVVVGRLKGDPHILVKMFKDIPEEDVEALLPHAEISMNWWDRAFMFGGGIGTIGSTTMKLLTASLLQWLWILTVGFGVLTWRVFHGYRRTRLQRDSQRTRHLYYQNLSNNLGSIYTLVSLISQEELKEAGLVYFICATADPPIQSVGDLKSRCESLLTVRFGSPVDFDVADAVRTLDRMKLWADRAHWRVHAPDKAAGLLSLHCIERRTEMYHWKNCG